MPLQGSNQSYSQEKVALKLYHDIIGQLFCRKPEFEGQKKIKKLVIWSFGGFLVWSVGLITWIAVFTMNR